jgi:hypothetical protein
MSDLPLFLQRPPLRKWEGQKPLMAHQVLPPLERELQGCVSILNRNVTRKRTQTEVIVKYGMMEWILLECVVHHLKYNPRHLPVVQQKMANEDYYLRLSIRRLLLGYRVTTTTERKWDTELLRLQALS